MAYFSEKGVIDEAPTHCVTRRFDLLIFTPHVYRNGVLSDVPFQIG